MGVLGMQHVGGLDGAAHEGALLSTHLDARRRDEGDRAVVVDIGDPGENLTVLALEPREPFFSALRIDLKPPGQRLSQKLGPGLGLFLEGVMDLRAGLLDGVD